MWMCTRNLAGFALDNPTAWILFNVYPFSMDAV